jgi:tetratricopeptide (TPR) repeat protein
MPLTAFKDGVFPAPQPGTLGLNPRRINRRWPLPHRASTCAATLMLLLCSTLSQAQTLKDAQWQALLDNGKLAELERAAQERLKSQNDDAQAVSALALALMEDGQSGKLEGLIPGLQACIDKKPQAVCHYALGRVYGQQAMTASVFKMPGLASKTKEQFIKAVELDPLMFDARSGLTQFYVMAPAMAGGSVTKARELADEAQAKQPEHAKILRFHIAASEKDWGAAEKELSTVRPGDDKALKNELRNAWSRLASANFEAKNLAKARQIFEALQRDYPGHAIGPYGLGRVLTALDQPDEAIKALERSRTLEGAERLPVDHRLGIALLAKGDKPAARAALERFVANPRANPRNLDDARKRLAEI